MVNEVFANGNEIACKSGDGKVIAAFPDVCMSPPSPPAGPIPIPYPNTSFSKDAKNGSKTVKIDGSEIMLKDKSFYKTSPLGNEAATRSFGASVVSHVITGKTYFVAWSMDVKVEGENVDRHIDLTTSNHASPMGSTPPNPNLDAVATGLLEDETKLCACCNDYQHSEGDPVDMDTWYTTDNLGAPLPTAEIQKYTDLMDRVKNLNNPASVHPQCTCKNPSRVVPEKPCNVFRNRTTAFEREVIEHDFKEAKRPGVREVFVRRDPGSPLADVAGNITKPSLLKQLNSDLSKPDHQTNHLTPQAAGGCATGPGNLQAHENLCGTCQQIDEDFGKIQNLTTLPPL